MIPRCWPNETAIIIASGPSLTQQDVDYCRNKGKVVVVNDNYILAPWANLLYAADPGWWEHHEGAPHFCGQKWTQDEASAKKYNLNWVAGNWHHGISRDPGYICYGWNSGFQALNLSFLMGAKRIILLGFDFQRTDGKRHWFGDHPGDLNKDSEYHKWIRSMELAAPRYEAAGAKIINASRATALNCFRKMKLEDCL